MLAAALDRCHKSRRRGWDTQLLGDRAGSIGVAASSLSTAIVSRLQGDESYETETRKCVSWLHLNLIGISTAVGGSDGLTSSKYHQPQLDCTASREYRCPMDLDTLQARHPTQTYLGNIFPQDISTCLSSYLFVTVTLIC
jgi:hypothetical protein